MNLELVTAVKDIATTVAVLAGAAYFAVRVFYQRMFQRLSVEIDVLPLDPQPGAGQREVAIECNISNKGEARIVLDCLCFKLDSHDWERFPPNIARGQCRDERDGIYAVDARSRAHFCETVKVPSGTRVLKVTVEFSPRKTGETYRTEKIVAIK